MSAVYKNKKKWSFTSIVYSIVFLELEENLHQGNKGQAKGLIKNKHSAPKKAIRQLAEHNEVLTINKISITKKKTPKTSL